jgi:hypothetical protein
MRAVKWWRKVWSQVATALSSGCDATFADLDWQAFSSVERKTIELDTRDLGEAVRALMRSGYVVVSIAEHAHLIYVAPASHVPHLARHGNFADALGIGGAAR